jgi:hypothetical protein
MSCNVTITTIDENECVGDSLNTINDNFAALDNAVCYLSARVTQANAATTLGVTSLSGYYKLDATPRQGAVTVSHKLCPQWHIGKTGRPLYQETGANRISQQIALSAEYLQHLQYVVSQNAVLSGGERIRVSSSTVPDNHEGAVLLADGMVFIPDYDSGTAGLFNPVTEVRTNVTQSLGKYFSSGYVLLPNGKVFLLRNGLPYGDAIAGFLFDPATNSFTATGGQAWNKTFYNNAPIYYAYYGQTLLPDGRVYINPSGNNNPIIIYDPATDTTTTTPQSSVGLSTSCASLADGRVYRIPGEGNLRAQIYNPYDNTLTTAYGIFSNTNSTYSGRGGWHSGCMMADGRIFMAPNQPNTGAKIFDPNATSDGTALFETPSDGYVTYGSIHDLFYGSCTLLPDGRIIALPYDTNSANTTAVIYDPKSNKNQTLNVSYTNNIGYLLKDGRLLISPYGPYSGPTAANFRYISFNFNENFSFAAISGPHMNQTY